MSQELNRVRLGEGVHFTSIRDRKFKHNCISINLLTPLEEETDTAPIKSPSCCPRQRLKSPLSIWHALTKE